MEVYQNQINFIFKVRHHDNKRKLPEMIHSGTSVDLNDNLLVQVSESVYLDYNLKKCEQFHSLTRMT